MFQSLDTRCKWVVILFALDIALALIALVSGSMEYQLLKSFSSGDLSGMENPIVEAEANDSRQRLIGISQIVLYVACIIAFCLWTYRAASNLRASGRGPLQFTPGWAVGWYFVPFANLVKPFQAMREIWQTSHGGPVLQSPPLLSAWWAFWLLTGFTGQLAFRLARRAETIDAMMSANLAVLASDAVSIIAALLAILIVQRVTAVQAQPQFRAGYIPPPPDAPWPPPAPR